MWLQVTVEEGRGEGGKVALLLSLSQHSDESATLRRVKHLKELSIDNKRMYCGLHGYALVIGEDLHSSRTADWDAVKLLAQHADQYEWLLWLPPTLTLTAHLSPFTLPLTPNQVTVAAPRLPLRGCRLESRLAAAISRPARARAGQHHSKYM